SGPAAALQPDGRLVIACEVGGSLPYRDVVLYRLTASGIPDSSFGTNGHVITDLSPGRDTAKGVAIRPDGRIVVAGWTEAFGVTKAFVMRYLSNGDVDDSFGDDGIVLIDFSGPFVTGGAMSLRLQPDGRIVIGGYGTPVHYADFAVARLEPHGVLDTSFGAGGTRLLDFPGAGEDVARALAFDDDGNALLAGHSNYNFAVTRIDGGQTLTGVPEAPRLPAALRVSAPRPNPTSLGASVELELNAAVRTSAAVFDVGGRVVRVLFGDRALEAGRHTLAWDGHDEAGRPVAAGVYFLRIATPGGEEVRRVAVVR
ncbi:MAG TPA: FlgD immunoglobulin-like domain containing protein, partial [Arenibaculum sp.]|nr:FlgD immunoglobulin-like domain containing protein [Arenibaculum sp.]